jgi:hypothetical protein
MVKMQMGVDDHVDVFSTETQALQGVQQGRGPLDGKHALKLVVLLGAQPCVYQNVLPVRPDQQTGETQRDAIQLIGFAALLPDDFGDDPEHGPTVQPESTVRYGIHFKRAEFHAFTEHSAFSDQLKKSDMSLSRRRITLMADS